MINNVKKAGLCALAIVLLATTIAVINHYYPEATSSEARLNTFSSFEELKNFINASRYNNIPQYYGRPASSGQFLTTQSLSRDVSAAAPESAANIPEYSVTNVQVAGVDEADIVKTDGEYIYVVSGNNVTIVKAYPASEAEIVSKIILNGTVRGIFINDNKLAVFEDTPRYQTFRVTPDPIGIPDTAAPYSYTSTSNIRVFDVTDRANPVSTRNVTLDGSYFDSRMIGDYVYAIISQPAIQWIYQTGYDAYSEVVLPKVNFDGQSTEVQPTSIYYSNVSDRFETYTTVAAVNVFDDAQEPTIKSFLLGYTSTMYVSQNNIYVTFTGYSDAYYAQKTVIHRIHIQDNIIEGMASGEVPGYVLNQFSMDENNGYFRIATTTGEVWMTGDAVSENHVYILDSDLEIVGKLENLAPGEKIYSARFMGNRAYLVTFKKIDPFFVLDLSDPFAPKVLGELEITGYSDYLHPYDENHVIGIGKETIEAEGGNFAWYQGVKISLFDVTNVADPKEIAKYEIGQRGTDSPVLRDHKAFLFDKSRNLLVLPVHVLEQAYTGPTWDGAYVFDISIEGGLVLKGKITHVEAGSEPTQQWWYYYSGPFSIQRSLFIDDVLYTISQSKIKMNALSDLTEINEVNLKP